MPHSASPSPPVPETAACSRRRRLRVATCWVIGILWAGLVLVRALGDGPEDSVTACRNVIYRDPVTGREQGIGSVRIAADGVVSCRGVGYRADRR